MKKILSVLLSVLMLMSFAGCGQSASSSSVEEEKVSGSIQSETEKVIESDEEEAAQAPEGTYFSELTGLPVSEDIKDRRPLAVMVDLEQVSLPNFGLSECDVIYEFMNNIYNGRISRIMAMVKEYDDIEMLGNVRSTRSTNVILAWEWNAILCHDGQSHSAEKYLAKAYSSQHFSGIFSRVNNGKATEFTEYILKGDIEKAFKSTGYSKNYNEYAPERDSHFTFVEYETKVDTEGWSDANSITLPFYHTNTTLKYNSETGTYDYYLYNGLQKDGDDDDVITFDNVIIQKCAYEIEQQTEGYIVYNVIQSNQPGYYLTNGKMEEITWTKSSELGITYYYDADGNEIEINRGKTYIALVPSDTWNEVSIK